MGCQVTMSLLYLKLRGENWGQDTFSLNSNDTTEISENVSCPQFSPLNFI